MLLGALLFTSLTFVAAATPAKSAEPTKVDTAAELKALEAKAATAKTASEAAAANSVATAKVVTEAGDLATDVQKDAAAKAAAAAETAAADLAAADKAVADHKLGQTTYGKAYNFFKSAVKTVTVKPFNWVTETTAKYPAQALVVAAVVGGVTAHYVVPAIQDWMNEEEEDDFEG